MRPRLTFLALVLAATTASGYADQIRPFRGRRPPIPGQAPAGQPQAAAPVAPLRPEQMPAVPPVITFTEGALTINAQNSTLGDILRGVRNQTGASVDMPGNATERVMGKFGPGPARDVLTSLLNGTHFNYVLMGSATDPEALDRVVLTAKSNGGEAPATQEASATPPPNQGPPPPAPAANAPDDLFGSASDQGDDASENIFATDDQNNTGDDQQAQNAPFGQPQQQPDARTPEQMLQDLQQQQAQQQQAQQQQGFNNGQNGQDQNGQQNGPQRPFPGRPFRGLPTPNGNNPSPNPEP